MKVLIVIGIVVVSTISVSALGAGVFTSSEDAGGGYLDIYGVDQNTEIVKYDSGVLGYSICWFTGDDHWVGNDFSVNIYSDINSMIIRTRDDWPNDGFDGFYIAIFDDNNGLPGEIIWPADGEQKLVDKNEIRANFDDEGWAEIDVNYSVDTDKIYACIEQYYNHPDADPFCVDDNPVDQGHSWENNGTVWVPMDTGDMGDITNNNLMLRIRATLAKGIRGSSFGAIKALYR